MNIKLEQHIDRTGWLKALQVKGAPGERLTRQMDEAEKLLKEAANPLATYRIMPRADITTTGYSIEKHLEGCHKVAVMGITLGAGVDALIRRTQVKSMAMTIIIDAGASVMVEQLADKFEEYIESNLEVGSYKTGRFSPGYGDYPVTEQPRVLRYIDGQRKIGLNVTEGCMMVPGKSITALIGIADHPVTGRLATCNECALKDKCTLRKEGKFCGN